MRVGDIVEYTDDWIKGRKWYLLSLYDNDLCTIVIIRDGKYTNEKNGEISLNASVVNLPITKIKQ